MNAKKFHSGSGEIPIAINKISALAFLISLMIEILLLLTKVAANPNISYSSVFNSVGKNVTRF